MTRIVRATRQRRVTAMARSVRAALALAALATLLYTAGAPHLSAG